MSDGLRGRLFDTGYEEWNNRWYIYLGAPVFVILGHTIASLFGVHLVDSQAGEFLILAFCILITMFLGFAVLALIDMRD